MSNRRKMSPFGPVLAGLVPDARADCDWVHIEYLPDEHGEIWTLITVYSRTEKQEAPPGDSDEASTNPTPLQRRRNGRYADGA